MVLKTVYIRFYKSFNFDYLRKFHHNAKPNEWENIDEKWYPFVEIPIDGEVTTIVGANESGKSHLLSAIKKGITGLSIERKDFCRYSKFFTVDEGQMLYPDFGFEWSGISDVERESIRKLFDVDPKITFNSAHIFRINKDKVTLYIPTPSNTKSTHQSFLLDSKRLGNVAEVLPIPFTINPEIVLPASISIKSLIETDDSLANLSRTDRFKVVESTETLLENIEKFETENAVSTNAPFISKELMNILGPYSRKNVVASTDDLTIKGIDLAKDLIFKIAKIDRNAIKDMYSALKEGDHGHVNALIYQINQNLANNLNFPKWWVQDKDFQLIVSARDFDLVFTIKDKTQTEYSFEERSSGLQNFLSYYIQYRAHEYLSGRQEILLMDEPDAFLSSQAQQDLLKIFQAFSNPDDKSASPIQVIYVTHSPFLIDKNHAERVRVLEKGTDFEGTRVVNDASKNHYEPLRSTIGSLVGETAYMGNCNIIVEGVADQILLSGVSQFLFSETKLRNDVLDLNNLTIVPAGGASHIPYLTYLARGRDIEKPAVVVLLDSDSQGDQQRKALRKGGPKGKQLLKEKYILQIGDIRDDLPTVPLKMKNLVELEDLIPLPICIRAAKKYAREICFASETMIASIVENTLESELNANTMLSKFDVISSTFTTAGEHIEKIGFARYVLEVIKEMKATLDSLERHDTEAFESFKGNMIALFRKLNTLKREALKETTEEKMSQIVEKQKNSFIKDFPLKATREDANLLFHDIISSLDDSAESDHIKDSIRSVVRDFALDRDVHLDVSPFDDFLHALSKVQYAALNNPTAVSESPVTAPEINQKVVSEVTV